MQLSDIKQFLDVYRKKLDSEDEKKKRIVDIILKEINISIDPKNISIKNGVLEINTNTVIKNELYLHREKILSHINEESKKSLLPFVHSIR